MSKRPVRAEHDGLVASAADPAAAGREMSAQIKMFLEVFPYFSAETVVEVQRRGLLSFPSHGLWRYGDDHNGSTRSLNGRKYIRAVLETKQLTRSNFWPKPLSRGFSPYYERDILE